MFLCVRVVYRELLRGITIITGSYNHTSHLDAETLQPILANNPGMRIINPDADRGQVATPIGAMHPTPISLWNDHAIIEGQFSFLGIPAAHNHHEYDDAGRDKFMGYIIRFICWTIPHASKTLLYPSLPDRRLSF